MATTAPTAAPSPAGGNVLPPKDEPTPEEARSAAEAAAELQKAHVALLTKEVERVGKKQRVARDKAVEVVDALLAEVRAARERLERTTDAGERSAAMNELRASLMEKDYPAQVTLTSVPVKEFHACVGKLGKAIDTVFDQPSHDELTWDHEMDERLVAEAVALHLYREGLCDLADEYVASKGLDDVVEMEIDETDVVDGRAEGADGAEPSGSERPGSEPPSDPVSDAAVEAAAERRKLRPLWDELRRITRAVSDDHDLDVVSDWIRTNRDALVASVGPAEGESLAREVEFMTAKIRYVKLLVAGDGAGAIAQGRATLGAFAESHAGEVRRLLAAAAYASRGLAGSPYEDVARAASAEKREENPEDEGSNPGACAGGDAPDVGSDWDRVTLAFRDAFFALHGQPRRSPLLVTVNAGCLAMPTLLKLSRVLATKGQRLSDLQQLPVEIPLGPDYVFHTVFACPVAREATAPDDPPMMLPCGLVLSQGSIRNMVRGNQRTFKCPYCPLETTVDSCRQIYF